MYFALNVIIINVVTVISKAVILALVEAHLSFFDMRRHKATQIWLNNGLDNGLQQAIIWSNVTYHQQCSVVFTWEQIRKKY